MVGVFTKLEKDRIEQFDTLDSKTRWKTHYISKKRSTQMVDDLIFVLENKENLGTICEMVGKDKSERLLKLLALDLGVEQTVLSPNLVVSIIEENRVLSEIISKKNKVWRDLLSQINSAKDLEDFVKRITENENVYIVDGESVRVHVRR